MQRGLIATAAHIEFDLQEGGVRYRSAMAHLTYAPGNAWEPRQITSAMDRLVKWASRKGYWVRFVWRFEYGAINGRPHYHVLVWLPRGVTMPMWDKAGWWPHGLTRMEWARRPVGYIAKYASKPSQLPSGEFQTKGARWWGRGGMTAAVRLALRVALAPQWVHRTAVAMGWRSRFSGEVGEDVEVRRLEFGWWRIGAFEFRSPWEFLGLDAGGGARVRFRGWSEGDYACV